MVDANARDCARRDEEACTPSSDPEATTVSRHFLVRVEPHGRVSASEIAPTTATPVGEIVTEDHGDAPQHVCRAALTALAAVMPDESACEEHAASSASCRNGRAASATVESTKAAGVELAAQHLERIGFEVIDREHETRYGRVDLIGADAERIVFCEVKVRGLRDSQPFGQIGEAHARHRRRIAAAWLGDRSDRPQVPELRFDTIHVVVDGAGRLVWLEHLQASR